MISRIVFAIHQTDTGFAIQVVATTGDRAPMDWNDRFTIADCVFGREPSQSVIKAEPRLARHSRVLCVADGKGHNSEYLTRQGHRVSANENAPNAIDKARSPAAKAGVQVAIEQADPTTWVWSRHAYDAVFEGLRQGVAPGGLILLHGYTPRQRLDKTGGPACGENLYTSEMLRQAFADCAQAFADCAMTRLEAGEAELNEGCGHAGRSALIDLVARTRDATEGTTS